MSEGCDADKNGRNDKERNNNEFKKVFHVDTIPHVLFSFNYFFLILYGADAPCMHEH